jgi:hypothetical protein
MFHSEKKRAVCSTGLLLVASAILFFISTDLRAQVTGAELIGTVTDPTGAAIPNASIVVKNAATGITRSTESNSAGSYVVPDLQPGDYGVVVKAVGFSDVHSRVLLTVGAQQLLNVRMKVGEVAQQVEVTATPASVELASSTVGGVTDSATTRGLPLNGRDWTQLATLQPGATVIRTQQPVGQGGAPRGTRGLGEQLSISGARAAQNTYRLDGIIQNDYANSTPGSVLGLALGAEAVQEFSVLTSGFSAEYGMTAGGVLNAVTRSGTNQFHGSAYEFLRNSALDARNFFDGSTIPPFHRHQFGASAGGPIRKDRTFIFGNYEGLRETQGTTNIAFVPSQAARNGQIHDKNGNLTPVTVDPKVQPFLALWPLPNGGLLGNGDTGQFIFPTTSVSNENFATVKVDHTFSERDTIFGTYLYDDGNNHSPDALNVLVLQNHTRRQSAGIQETHLFNSQFLQSLRVGFNRDVALTLNTAPGASSLGTDITLGAIPGKNAPWITVPGLTQFQGGVGGQAVANYRFTDYQFFDEYSLNKGIHAVKFGFNLIRYQDNYQLDSSPTGRFTFNSLTNFLTNRPLSFLTDVYAPEALAGGSSGNVVPFGERGVRQTVVAGYVQDDVRLFRNLMINLGVRYEAATVPAEVRNELVSLPTLPAAQFHLGSPFFSNPTLRNFEPRIGFAWDPLGKGKTSVRGSFGIYDLLPMLYLFNLQQGLSAPWALIGTLNTPAAGSFPNGAYGVLTSNPKNLSLRMSYTEQNPHRSYVQQWGLSIQQFVTRSLVATVAYTGSRGVHVPFDDDNANYVVPSLTSAGYLYPSPTAAVVNPNYGTTRMVLFNGNNEYNSLTLKLQKQLSKGFQMQGAFTWSKSFDDGSAEIAGDVFTNSVSTLFWFDPRLNRAVSDYHIGRNLVLNGLWEIPIPHWNPGLAKTTLGGWELAGIFQASDGLPFTPVMSGDALGQGNGGGWEPPTQVACSHLTNPGNPHAYVNLSCYSFPNPVNLLSHNYARRNSLTGPGLLNFDASLIKNTRVSRISETFNVQFRAEFFNVLNRSNFALPNSTIFNAAGATLANAGVITSTATTAREIQLGLKVIW